MTDHYSDSSRETGYPEGDANKENSKSTTEEFAENSAFRDASECPNCGMVRPFGQDCMRCGWETSTSRTESDDSPSLDRVVFAAIAADKEPIATSKAAAALKQEFDTFDLLAEFEHGSSAFPNKWGTLPGVADVETDGDELLEKIESRLGSPGVDTGRDAPVVYTETGEPVCTLETLADTLGGEDTILEQNKEKDVKLVPAVVYTEPDTETREPPTLELECPNCPSGVTTYEFAKSITDTASVDETDSEGPTRYRWRCQQCKHTQLGPDPKLGANGEQVQSAPPRPERDRIDPAEMRAQAEAEEHREVMQRLEEEGKLDE
jgi:hypothetical protein